MKKILLTALLCIFWSQPVTPSPAALPTVSHYSLQFHFFPKEGRFEADTKMTVTNKTEQAFSEVPFLLYRLLEVKKVSDNQGSALCFDQAVVKMEGPEYYRKVQANLVKVQLPKPLPPGATMILNMSYDGWVYGYSEAMAYVRDRIAEPYSLLRPDALAYPMLAQASRESLHNAYGTFTYDLAVTVPTGYIVACGGSQEKTLTKEDKTTFVFKSKIPTSRIDIAAAKFKLLKDEAKKLTVYVLPEDEKNGVAVLNGVNKAVLLYSAMFGEIKDYQGYTVIEIPDGWGAQAGDYYILQEGTPFKDLKYISRVYHEVGHSWNAKPKPEVQRCRWFDEAFAAYFESLAIREFEGEQAFQKDMETTREYFISRAKSDQRNFETPIAEYGKYELGGNSYTKGAWSLYVLHQLVGEEQFKQIIRAFLSEFRDKPADFKDFQRVAERVSRRNLDKYFNEWIYGAASSQLLLDKVSVADVIKRY